MSLVFLFKDEDHEMDNDLLPGSFTKGHIGDQEEEDEQLPAHIEVEGEQEACRDEADEFEERIMRAIERNIRRSVSEEEIAIDMYDDQTVYV